jgi:hypothetical protein
MHRRIDPDQLPASRVVVEFQHTEPTRTVIWMVLDRGEASVCVQHPGFDPDLVVTATTPALAEVFAGIDTWGHALASGAIEIDGPPALVKRVPRWFLGSPFSDATHEMVLARQEP